MLNKKIMELESLCVEAKGLADMTMALRDCFIDGPNAPESYNGAIDLMASLMQDFQKSLNTTTLELIKG